MILLCDKAGAFIYTCRAKVLAAEAWDERAGEFMARVQREGLKDTDRPSMEEFHLLVVDGISNGMFSLCKILMW